MNESRAYNDLESADALANHWGIETLTDGGNVFIVLIDYILMAPK